MEENERKNAQNKVARKFNIIVTVTKVFGYFIAVLTMIITTSVTSNFGTGFLYGVSIAIATWLSTLLFEAIAEGLNLLQDINNRI